MRKTAALLVCLAVGMVITGFTLPTQPANISQGPKIASVTPPLAIIRHNQELSCTVTIDDLAGYKDIAFVYFTLSRAGKAPLYVVYSRAANTLYLRNDQNTAWLSTSMSGNPLTLENESVQVLSERCSVTPLGPRLVICLKFLFKLPGVGRHNVAVRVFNARLQTDTYAPRVLWYVVPSPAITRDSVLAKLRATYSQFRDMQADAEMETLLDGKSIAPKLYGRYTLVAPDRERMELFADATRSRKIDETTTIGQYLYLQDFARGRRQKVDLLQDAGVSRDVFESSNFMYKLDAFLARHTVTLLTSGGATLWQVVLDAVPNEPTPGYTKLRLTVDYAKGLVVGIGIMQGDVILQELGYSGHQMAGDMWTPTLMTKTARAQGSTMVTTMVLRNVKVNSGVSIPAPFD